MTSNLKPHERSAVLPTVRYLVTDPDAAPVMGDKWEDEGHPLAELCRQARDVVGWMRLLACGTWRARALCRRLRGMIRIRASVLAAARACGDAVPEGVVERDTWRPTCRESTAAGTAADPHLWAPWGTRLAPREYCRVRHLRRLVERGLAGEDVPPDVSADLVVLREAMKLVILAGGF